MTRMKDIVEHISQKTGHDEDATIKIFEELFYVIAENCANAEETHFTSFGTFVPKIYDERVRMNPATREKVIKPKCVLIKFVPSRTYKKELTTLAKFSSQKPID